MHSKLSDILKDKENTDQIANALMEWGFSFVIVSNGVDMDPDEIENYDSLDLQVELGENYKVKSIKQLRRFDKTEIN